MAEQPKEVILETSMVCHLSYAELFHYYSFFLQGNITVELYWNHAPKTCTNFAVLVRCNLSTLHMYHLFTWPYFRHHRVTTITASFTE